MVVLEETSRVIVLFVNVFTKICMVSSELEGSASVRGWHVNLSD